MSAMLGKLACMRQRSGRHLKPGREKRIYKRAMRAREKREGQCSSEGCRQVLKADRGRRVPQAHGKASPG